MPIGAWFPTTCCCFLLVPACCCLLLLTLPLTATCCCLLLPAAAFCCHLLLPAAGALCLLSPTLPAQVSTLGLFVDAGSQCEYGPYRGVGQFLENLAFKSTTTRTREQIQQ